MTISNLDILPIPVPVTAPTEGSLTDIGSRTSTNESLATSHSSSGSERIVVDQASIIKPILTASAPSMARTTFFSALLAKDHPAITSTTTTSTYTPARSVPPPPTQPSHASTPTNIKPKIEPLLDASGNAHVCTSNCRRIATPEEKSKCGYIAHPVSYYSNKAVYGNETPSKIRAMDSMKTRYQMDKLRPNCLWYHHNNFCEGYPCRGEILYCTVVNRCFFRERCVKHYAMRSRERCIPFNDGIAVDGSFPSTSLSSAQVKPRLMPPTGNLAPRTEFTPQKRQISNGNNETNDINGLYKRSRSGISPVRDAAHQHQIQSFNTGNQNLTPPSSSTSKTVIRLNFASSGKDQSNERSTARPEQSLLTPSTGLDRLSPSRQVDIEGEDEIDPYNTNGYRDDSDLSTLLTPELEDEPDGMDGIEDEDEDEKEEDETAMMWKGMYTQTKGELDATTVHLLQVQDDLAIEREKRIESEKLKKQLEKKVAFYRKELNDSNDKVKKEKEEEKNNHQNNVKLQELSNSLDQAQIEIQRLKEEVERLKKEKIAIEDDRDERINRLRSIRDLLT